MRFNINNIFRKPNYYNKIIKYNTVLNYFNIKNIQISKNCEIFLAKNHITNEYVIIKKCNNILNINQFILEANFLEILKNVNGISRLKHICLEKPYFLILKRIKGFELFYYILKNTLSYDMKKNILKQLCEIIQNIHFLQIIHLDIKLENIMITETDSFDRLTATIIDFGLSLKNGDIISKYRGTQIYSAPELLKLIFKNNNKNIIISPKLDIWSLGIVIYYMFFSYEYGELNNKILKKIEDNTFLKNKKLKNIELFNLINLMHNVLKTDPEERLSLVNILKHDLFLFK